MDQLKKLLWQGANEILIAATAHQLFVEGKASFQEIEETIRTHRQYWLEAIRRKAQRRWS